MAEKILPIEHRRGRYFDYIGTVRKGRHLRDMATPEDVVTFTIYPKDKPDIHTIRKSTGAGVTANTQGEIRVQIAGNEMDFDTRTQYEWELVLEEGDTGQPYTLASGPFTLKNATL